MSKLYEPTKVNDYQKDGEKVEQAVGEGKRYDKGKVRYELMPTHLLESTARVLEFGAQKYQAWNWCSAMPVSKLIGCLKRHVAEIERGDDIDEESGQRHVGHAICNLLFLEHQLNMIEQGVEGAKELDDRPHKWFGSIKSKNLPPSGDG